MWEKVTNLTQGTEPLGMCRVSPGRKREGRVDIGVGSSRVAPGEYRDSGFSELALVAPVWVCSWGLRGIPALGPVELLEFLPSLPSPDIRETALEV